MRRIAIGGSTLAIVALSTTPALAQSKQAVIAVSTRYEDNLVRAPEALRNTLPADGADLVTAISISGGIVTKVGDIQLNLLAGGNQSFYANNSRFNAFGYQGRAEASYDTETTSLSASAERNRAQSSFGDASFGQRSLQNITRLALNGSRDVLGDFRVVGRFGLIKSDSSGILARNNNQLVTFNGGIGYYSPTGNSITLEYQEAHTSSSAQARIVLDGATVFFSPRSRDFSILSTIAYSPGPATKVNVTIGYSDHDDQTILNADFKGLTANASISWMPMTSLTITPTFSRGFSSENRLFSNGVRITSYGLTTALTLGERWQTSFSYARVARLFRYDVQSDNPLSQQREETSNTFGAMASYQTNFDVAIQLSFQHASRSASLANYNYSDNIVSLSLSRQF